MMLKNKKTPLLFVVFTFAIFAASSAMLSDVNLRADYHPADSQDRVVPGALAQIGTAAFMARSDLSSGEFTIGGDTRLPESEEARSGEERGERASLVLIGLGFTLFGCSVLIRRGKTA